MDWCPYIKETFNGFGNAIEYLGRYTHKIAISNSRILSVYDDTVTFSARGKKPGEPKRQIILDHTEFIRRYLQHAAHRKDIWHFLIKSLCHEIPSFKDLRKKVCEAYPFIGYDYAIIPKMVFVCFIPDQNFSFFTKREKYYPHIPIG